MDPPRSVYLAVLPTRISGRIEFATGDACYRWTGPPSSGGYGKVYLDGRVVEAHRAVYGLIVGFPDGLDLDHTCHNSDASCVGGADCSHRLCVRIGHLEPKTRGQNVMAGHTLAAVNAAKTHCNAGHEYRPETTVIDGGWRRCLICRRERDAERRLRRRLKVLAGP